MQYKEIDDLYRTRRTPWVPIALGVVLAVGVVAYLLRDRLGSRDAAEPAAAAAPTEGASPAPAPAQPAVGVALPPPDPARPAIPAAELNAALAAARQLEQADKLVEARDKLLALVEDPRSLGTLQAQVEDRLSAISILLVTTPRAMPGKVDYTIQRGDSLSKIAAKFNCPAELIQKANGIANARVVRPGDVIRVLDHPAFAIEVDKRGNTLLVTLGGRFFKRYAVGTGAYGKTPEGTFVVRDKIVEPPWWRPDGKVVQFGDPENILGTRWMALQSSGTTQPVSGYGIHGTWDDSSIGKQSSAGCVRMRNSDVEEVFMLVPRGTPVAIRG